MKKLVFAFVCLCTLAGTAALTGCSKSDPPPPTTQQQLVGKWTIQSATGYYIVMGDARRDTTYFTSSDFVQFNADSTLLIHDSVNEGSDTLTGKWKVENNKLVITESDYMDYPNGFDITTLTGSELQLFYKETNSFATLEQKLNLTR